MHLRRSVPPLLAGLLLLGVPLLGGISPAPASAPHKDIFPGPPHERRPGLHAASMTITNALPGDTRNASRDVPDYTPILAAFIVAGGLWLASRLAPHAETA
jgi:hypothetical protein